MNFNQYYFKEEQLDEKITGIGDLASKTSRAIGVGLARGVANVFRGMTGRMKNIAFNPEWLKVLRPISQANYKKAIELYSSWRNKKTKLGPKQSFSVVDVANGVFGEFSKKTGLGRQQYKQSAYDALIDILKKYDSKVPADKIDMEAEIKPRITVYLLNNNGKIIFFDLPIGEDGKKRYYAMGLDNKAERAFTLIHGMRFEDFVMDPSEEATGGEENKSKQSALEKGILKYRYEVPPKIYKELIPKVPSIQMVTASYELYNLLNIFEMEVLKEKIKYVYKNKEGKWMIATAPANNPQPVDLSDKKTEFIVVKTDKPVGSKDKAKNLPIDKEGQKEFEKDIKNYQSKENDLEKDQKYGLLFVDIKDELDPEQVPARVKGGKTKDGWRFILKNGGVIYVYETIDGKYMIGFDEKAKKVVDDKDLIRKYKLEVAKETSEVESLE